MCKRLLVLAALLLMMSTAALADGVGVFDNYTDIGEGGPKGVGSTQLDYVTTDGLGSLVPRYIVTGSGNDIWGKKDQFQFAYKNVTGDLRLTATVDWNITAGNSWAKAGVMMRDIDGGAGAVSFQQLIRRDNDGSFFQARNEQGAGSFGIKDWWEGGTQALGIQRVTGADGVTVMQGLVDRGSGWENNGIYFNPNLPDAIGAGLAVTSHSNNDLVQAFFTDVEFSDSPELIGISALTPDLEAACGDVAGFMVRGIQPLVSEGWGYAGAAELLATGMLNGLPAVPGSDVTIHVPVVNFKDTANGAFDNDMSFPGVDPFEQPAGDPAAGDDDNNFAAEVNACIYLTPGWYKFGANSDDGTILTIGGVEVLRTEEWKGASNRDTDWLLVEEEGYFSLHAQWHEGGGGANLELHQVLLDGSRILLGDVDAGGAPVYVPEPATIALLGLGSLALIRRRKGA